MDTAKIKNPNEINCTLELTMKLKDWKQIRTTLNKNPAYAEIQLIGEITDLILQLEKTFFVSDQ